MNSGKTIFAQLMDFLPIYEFHQCVQQYHGYYKMKRFSCWDQFLCMAFGACMFGVESLSLTNFPHHFFTIVRILRDRLCLMADGLF